MSIVQLFMVIALCFVATAPDGVVLADDGRDWLSVVYMAFVAGAGWRCSAQTWAQAHLSPTRTAIIMSMEPVFAAFFAVLLGGESLTVADGRRRGDGARRDAGGRAAAAPQDRGRGPAPHRLRRTVTTVRRGCQHPESAGAPSGRRRCAAWSW